MIIKKIKVIDNSVDPLKERVGKNLIIKNNKLVEDQDIDKIKIIYKGAAHENTSDGFYQIRQKIILPDVENFNVPGGDYGDHMSEIIAPVHINEIAVNDDSKAVSSGYVKTKFNFVSEQYEKFSQELSERALPCIYLENDPQQTKTIMDQKVFTRVIPNAIDFYDFEYKLRPRYVTPDLRKNANLMFGQNFSFAIGNSEKDKYPFYNNIRFNYNTKNDFKNALKQFNFFEHFIDDFINSRKPRKRFKVQESQKESSVSLQTYNMFDALTWLQKSDFSFDETNKLVFEPTQKYKNPYQYYLDKLAFVGKMRKFCKSKMRDIQQIHENKVAASEVLFYKIDKFVERSSTPIQTIWVPGDDNYVDYVDTQIKYGVKYTYKVSAFVMVFGSSYRYENIQKTNKRITVDAIITPSFKVIEVNDIFVGYCRTIQPPQPVPNVFFVNETSKEDYIKIHMNLTVNSENTELKPINPSDMAQENLRIDYDRLEERPRFVYNNERALYEIYRTDFIPQSYQDLQGHKIAEIRNSFPSTGAVFKDYINPWQKYYYVVRCINIHGLVSNPTPIYEIELTKDADETFLSVQAVPFHVENNTQPVRSFMKLFQAIPATQHTFYDEDEIMKSIGEDVQSLKGLALGKMTLGGAKHPIWGKKFKFRITSKDSGRKFDVNVKVNLIKKKTMENSK